MQDFKNLIVWQLSRQLAVAIYRTTELYPPSEKFRLVNQLCRAAASIGANIAEGASRKSQQDFRRFLEIAVGSTNEVEHFLLISADLGYIKPEDLERMETDLRQMRASLISLMRKVCPPNS